MQAFGSIRDHRLERALALSACALTWAAQYPELRLDPLARCFTHLLTLDGTQDFIRGQSHLQHSRLNQSRSTKISQRPLFDAQPCHTAVLVISRAISALVEKQHIRLYKDTDLGIMAITIREICDGREEEPLKNAKACLDEYEEMYAKNSPKRALLSMTEWSKTMVPCVLSCATVHMML